MYLLRTAGFMSEMPATGLGWEFIVSSLSWWERVGGGLWGQKGASSKASNARRFWGILFIPHLDHPRYLTSSCSVAHRPEVWDLLSASPWS